MSKIFKFVKNNIFLVLLFLFTLLVLAINIRINVFRFDNFDYGKFDLGNMAQMLWNTMHGRFMYLTDYFGGNVPRWAMSHVDPILLIFLPIFAVFQHAMSLTYSQIVLILFSCILVYKIAELELKSKFVASLLGLAYLFYPAVGFLTAWTGFHGVSAAIPFFFAAFYVFERMYKDKKFTKTGLILFWILLVITMSGKEQLPLYIIFYGFFILILRNPVVDRIELTKKWFDKFLKSFYTKLSLSMMLVGTVWFILAFFVIIPHYSSYRVESYQKFTESLGLNETETRDVALPNYFLSRYDAFGSSYTDIAIGMLLNPNMAISVIFGGDKPDNLMKTFGPLVYLPLAYPLITLIALPDLAINYLTSTDGVGTSEITNHRISMIIPVLFIATIYAIGFLSTYLSKFTSKTKRLKINKIFGFRNVTAIFAISVLAANIYMTFYSNNPVYLWLTQALQKRVFAKTDEDVSPDKDLKVGDVLRLSELEYKDRECAGKIVSLIPENASVSGPDYLGAHLGLRETYAIFPALYNEADYVIVDVFSKKILTILDVNVDLSREVVGRIIKDENYKLELGCGNMFVFKKIGPHGKDKLLPMQERFKYAEKFNYELFQSLFIVDYDFPKEIKRQENKTAKFVYIKRSNPSLNDYFMFMSFVNKKTGDIYQTTNLPSFGITQPKDWQEGRYYIESIDIAVPEFLDVGDYSVFVGMGNNIRTRSMYLGDAKIY